MRILAVKLRAIGDSVIWTSALKRLAEAFPTAEVHVLSYESNAAVFENLRWVHAFHGLKSKSRWELIRALWGFRVEKFDWLLGFHASTSLCRWAWLAGAEKMALHHHSWAYTPRGSVPIPHAGALESAIIRDHRVVEAMGVSLGKTETRLAFSAAESEQAEALLAEAIRVSGGDPSKPRYLFLPGASHALRRYPKDLWWPLIRRVRDEGRFQPVILADRALSEEWNLVTEAKAEKVPLLHGEGLRGFMGLISRGHRALANDSGPGHIAVACGLPTAFVFGPGCAGDWHPYDRTRNPLLRASVPCRSHGPRDQEMFQFCTVNECSHHRCMREIRIEGI